MPGPDLAAYNLGVAAAVRSDLTASVRLPDGGQVYVFGDTLAVNGQVICGSSRCPPGCAWTYSAETHPCQPGSPGHNARVMGQQQR